jgi:hypothetical protein
LNWPLLLLLLLLLLRPPVEAEEVASVLLPLVAVAVVLEALVLLPPPDFFHGWNPLPTAASASGGGLFDDNLLHWAANMAKGVPLNPGCSCNNQQVNHSISWLLQQKSSNYGGWNDKSFDFIFF